jgi:hypothetical protein
MADQQEKRIIKFSRSKTRRIVLLSASTSANEDGQRFPVFSPGGGATRAKAPPVLASRETDGGTPYGPRLGGRSYGVRRLYRRFGLTRSVRHSDQKKEAPASISAKAPPVAAHSIRAPPLGSALHDAALMECGGCAAALA